MFNSSQIKDNRLLIRASPAFYFKISESSSGLFIYCFFFGRCCYFAFVWERQLRMHKYWSRMHSCKNI